MATTLKQLANRIGAELEGNGDIAIESANTLEDATAGQISFLSNPRYEKQLETTQATAVIVGPGA